MKKINHILEAQQFSPEFMAFIFKNAENLRRIKESERSLPKILDGMVMASLFYEPSTRTRFSFESAMLNLGGGVISSENAREYSSVTKGESLEDSIRTVDKYSDIIVMRHFNEGSAQIASKVSRVPIINAGDGPGQHPTQALLDMYTIEREIGRLEGLNILLVGDLKHGRTVRSLCYLLGKYPKNKFTFISPKKLKMKEDIKKYLDKKGCKIKESDNLNKHLGKADIIYMTRIQKERLLPEEASEIKSEFAITPENLDLIKQKSRLLHPLPHVEEIQLKPKIEKKDKRVAYFRQVENGLYIRMALLEYLIG